MMQWHGGRPLPTFLTAFIQICRLGTLPGFSMRRAAIYRIQRFFAIISFVVLLAIGLIVARMVNMGIDWNDLSIAQNVTLPLPVPVIKPSVALISGHAGYDSGAICVDDEGNTILTEADVTVAFLTPAASASSACESLSATWSRSRLSWTLCCPLAPAMFAQA